MYDRNDFGSPYRGSGPRARGGRFERGYDRPAFGYDRFYQRSSAPRGPRAPRADAYDYWILGERELLRQGYRDRYDDVYRHFDERTRPRFSPVGGMYPPTGGYRTGSELPRPVRENTRFSDWTRWF